MLPLQPHWLILQTISGIEKQTVLPRLLIFARSGSQPIDLLLEADLSQGCLQEGHRTSECENNRTIDRSAVPDLTEKEIMDLLKEADEDRDVVKCKLVCISGLRLPNQR